MFTCVSTEPVRHLLSCYCSWAESLCPLYSQGISGQYCWLTMKKTTTQRELSWTGLTGRLSGREWSEARIKPTHIISLACYSQQHSPSEPLPTPFNFNDVPSIYRKVKISTQSLTVISLYENVNHGLPPRKKKQKKKLEDFVEILLNINFMYSKPTLQILLLSNKPCSHLKPSFRDKFIKICLLIALSQTEILGGTEAVAHWHWLLNHRCCYFHPTHWSACNPLLEDLCAVEQSNCVAAKWARLNWSEDLMRTPWGLSAVA